MNYWPLASIALVALGFALRWNAALVVVCAGLASGLLAGLSISEILSLLGETFAGNRALLLFVLTLPAIGLLERFGLREHAEGWVTRMRGLTLVRLLVGYLALRQLSSMVGLTHALGHAQTVRPLLAPMSEAAAQRTLGALTEKERQQVRAMAAATDNIGLFFGEDVFVAIGAVLLIQSFYAQHEIELEPLAEGRRLLDTIGWAALLPMLLATLGGVFSATGVGDAIARLTSLAIPPDSRLACVLAYGLGMVAFTFIMGNAFAAFPVMTLGVGLPFLVTLHHADPAIVGALGMLTGYCGTLMTPMAANFNIVPAALLELDDPHAVIRAQLPTALVLLATNLALMYSLAFP